MKYEAVIFDKDGTLIDMDATWGVAMTRTINQLCKDEESKRLLSHNLGLDLETSSFKEDALAPRTTWTNLRMIIGAVVDPDEFTKLNRDFASESLTEIEGATKLIKTLKSQGFKVAMATNHTEDGAYRHTEQLGITDYFDCILACDSGFGSKPEPGMLIEAMNRMQSTTDNTLMVGDTTSDLGAAKRAGLTYAQLGNLAQNDTGFEPDHLISQLAEVEPLVGI